MLETWQQLKLDIAGGFDYFSEEMDISFNRKTRGH
jgi:hypothetical protein